MNAKEWLDNAENKRKVEERKALLEQWRAGYKPEHWEKIKVWFAKQPFPTTEFNGLNADSNSLHVGEIHQAGKETHVLTTYTFTKNLQYGYSIVWKYNVCPDCKEVITKKGTILNPYENLAFVKYFVRNGGQEVVQTQASELVKIFDGELGL